MDMEFQEFSRQLMGHFIEGHFILVLSDLTVQELAEAPEHVRARLMVVPEEHIEALQLDSEAMDLADAYISEGVISEKLRADAQHIAITTVARVDVRVSWNFKHIVNLHRIHGTTPSTCAEGIQCSRSGLRKRCCEMSNAKKQFDAVEMMRSIRDRLSAQIQGMTLEKKREWLASQELTDPFLRRIRDKAAQQGAAAAGAARHR